MGAKDNRGCGHCGCGDSQSPKKGSNQSSNMNKFNEERDEVDQDFKKGYLNSNSFRSSKNANDDDEESFEEDDDDFYDDEEEFEDEDEEEDEDEPSDDEEIEESRSNKKPPRK